MSLVLDLLEDVVHPQFQPKILRVADVGCGTIDGPERTGALKVLCLIDLL